MIRQNRLKTLSPHLNRTCDATESIEFIQQSNDRFVISGAGATAILDQFLDEKEGNLLTSYQDAGGVWTICRGVTQIDGKPVKKV